MLIRNLIRIDFIQYDILQGANVFTATCHFMMFNISFKVQTCILQSI